MKITIETGKDRIEKEAGAVFAVALRQTKDGRSDGDLALLVSGAAARKDFPDAI